MSAADAYDAVPGYARLGRTRRLEGRALPAFIRNGHNYFVDIEVYEDGAVECWGLVDLPGFRAKLAKGWVRPSVPDGQAISVHGLGAWPISQGRWEHTADTFYEHVAGVVRALNPAQLNLYTHVPKARHGVQIDESGHGQVYYEQDPAVALPTRIGGSRLHVLYQATDGACYLADLHVFPAGQVHLQRLPEPLATDLPGLRALAAAGRLLTELPPDTELRIWGLGAFRVGAGRSVALADKLGEIEDLAAGLDGQPTSAERCRAAYEAFMAGPTIARREALRTAYEQVPAHRRRYLGDMDRQDTPIRLIIYGAEQIEFWSHYAAAKAQGLPLPAIRVPRPADE
jgi:hypothetical protein